MSQLPAGPELLGIVLSGLWWLALVGAFVAFIVLAIRRLRERSAQAEALDDTPIEFEPDAYEREDDPL